MKNMKKLLTALALITLSSLTFAQKAGDKIEFKSTDFNGAPVTSELFSKNKLTMVNIWGTFCPPCIREMPDLARLNEANKSKGVEVIGIPIDVADRMGKVLPKTKADGEEIIKATGAAYTHVLPTMDMFSTFLGRIQAVPATIFVDQNGKMAGQMYLGAKTQKDWQKIIDELLAKQK